MNYLSLGKKMFFSTVALLILFHYIEAVYWIRLFIGSFGFGGALVLWIIEKSSTH